MRVLIIRHGESGENVLSASVTAEVCYGLLTAEEGQKKIRAEIGKKGGNLDMDSPLSEAGEQQAAAFCDFWCPALAPASPTPHPATSLIAPIR